MTKLILVGISRSNDEEVEFWEQWISLIMRYITSVFYSILINGQLGEVLKPQRGIRQGDHISPSLFLICNEELNALLNKRYPTSKRGSINQSPIFYRWQFVILSGKYGGMFESSRIVGNIHGNFWTNYEFQKILIFFNLNAQTGCRTQILNNSGVHECQSQDKYLELSSVVGRSKLSSFPSISKKVWTRVNNWKNKFLSQARKEILLNTVIQAIPTYSMSVFLLPKKLCKGIASSVACFWWGHKQNERKIH